MNSNLNLDESNLQLAQERKMEIERENRNPLLPVQSKDPICKIQKKLNSRIKQSSFSSRPLPRGQETSITKLKQFQLGNIIPGINIGRITWQGSLGLGEKYSKILDSDIFYLLVMNFSKFVLELLSYDNY